MRIRERSFAYTRMVVCANANGREKASCSLRSGALTPLSRLRVPFQRTVDSKATTVPLFKLKGFGPKPIRTPIRVLDKSDKGFGQNP